MIPASTERWIFFRSQVFVHDTLISESTPFASDDVLQLSSRVIPTHGPKEQDRTQGNNSAFSFLRTVPNNDNAALELRKKKCQSRPTASPQHPSQCIPPHQNANSKQAQVIPRAFSFQPSKSRKNAGPVLEYRSSQISVARNRSLFDTFEILALDQGLDLLLDHRDVGFELRRELGDGFGEERSVGEFFALSVERQ
jgi:hypothetical protein